MSDPKVERITPEPRVSDEQLKAIGLRPVDGGDVKRVRANVMVRELGNIILDLIDSRARVSALEAENAELREERDALDNAGQWALRERDRVRAENVTLAADAVALRDAFRQFLSDIQPKVWGDTSRGRGIGGQTITGEGQDEYDARVHELCVRALGLLEGPANPLTEQIVGVLKAEAHRKHAIKEYDDYIKWAASRAANIDKARKDRPKRNRLRAALEGANVERQVAWDALPAEFRERLRGMR